MKYLCDIVLMGCRHYDPERVGRTGSTDQIGLHHARGIHQVAQDPVTCRPVSPSFCEAQVSVGT